MIIQTYGPSKLFRTGEVGLTSVGNGIDRVVEQVQQNLLNQIYVRHNTQRPRFDMAASTGCSATWRGMLYSL